MKTILVLIASLLLHVAEASFSVDLTNGRWMESAQEGSTHREWNGKKWAFQGDKPPSIYHFNNDKLLIKVTFQGKAPIAYSYDAKGRLVKREEGSGRYIQLILDDKGRVVEERAPLGKDATPVTLARFVYHSKSTEVYDPYGFKKIYHYNDSNEIVEIEHFAEEGLYKIERFKWEGGLLKKQTLLNNKGEEILIQKNVWSSSGRLNEQIITGDLTGHGKKETFSQKYHYNKQGALKKVTGSDGSTFPIPEDKINDAVVQKRADGLPDSKTRPNGDTEQYEWDIYGNLAARTTSMEGGKRVTFTYDYMNRLIRESDGFSFEYDYLGREVKRIDPDGNVVDFVYDALGRLIKKIEPEVLSPEGLSIRPTTRFKYNELDQMVEMTDADGWISHYAYTVRGQLCRVETPGFPVENIYYELNGLKEGEKTPPPPEPESSSPPANPDFDDSVETLKVINDRGQQVVQKTFVDFAGIKSVRTFDALGRLERVEKYNLLGELFQTREIRYTATGIKAYERLNDESVAWKWGAAQRLISITENPGTNRERKTRFYYTEGRVRLLVKPSGAQIGYRYNEDGSLNSLYAHDGSLNAAFIWNEEGRLIEAQNLKTNKSTKRFYDAQGRLIKEILENGLEVVWEEDALLLPDKSRIRYIRDSQGILKAVQREDAERNVLYTHTYLENDALGAPKQEEMILGLGVTTYQRDKEMRITSISSPYHNNQLAYDGFLLKSMTVDGKTQEFSYDAELKLIGKSAEAPILDFDGNTIEAQGHSLKYDVLGRLIEVDGKISYEYDVFGRRISKSTSDEEILYLWDGMEEIGAATPKGKIVELKILGAFGPVAVELKGIPYAALLDAKGSVQKLVSEKGGARSPWTYQGKREDPETGFIYFGARFLDPGAGRFLTPDPKGYADGQDLYQFARYNPNLFSDKWGHTAILDSCKSVLAIGWNTFTRLQQQLAEWRELVDNMSGLRYLQNRMEDAATLMLGKGFLIQSGYWRQEGQTGVYGEGEINDKVRISFNHGILNIRSDLADNLRQISIAHGGCNVHYVFRPTNGFTWDIMKCFMVKCGYLSPEAKELIRIWRGLIDEMGGLDGGGKIIHYTHSVGGSDTYTALAHLSDAEQKMMDIRTFGSATLIPDTGTYNITNYVSKRDGVSFFDPIHYFEGLFFNDGSIVFVGSLLGCPLVDHPLAADSYQIIIRALGQAFLETYGN